MNVRMWSIAIIGCATCIGAAALVSARQSSQAQGSASARIHQAVNRNDLDLLKRLVREDGTSVNSRDRNGRTPLHAAIARRQRECAEILLAAGADPNVADANGATPLSYTFSEPPIQRELADLLIARGAYVPLSGDAARQLLHAAAAGGDETIVDRMVEKGAELNSLNENGGTLLHSAAAGGLRSIADLLLGRGADPNRRDHYGWTPLHVAAWFGHETIASALLDAGADLDAATPAGERAWTLALEHHRDGVLKVLGSRGASRQPARFPTLTGKYFGQRPPGRTPELFAPGIVSTPQAERKIVFTAAGTEAYWSRDLRYQGEYRGTIIESHVANGSWTPPRSLPFSAGSHFDHNVALSADGRLLVFASNRPAAGRTATTIPGSPGIPASDLWQSRRTAAGWSEPEPLGSGVNTDGDEDCPVLAADGTLYFSALRPDGGFGIYRARRENGRYTVSDRMPAPINTEYGEMPDYVAPDQQYLLFRSMRPGGFGRADVYTSFRGPRGTWSEPVNMGDVVNAPPSRFIEITRDSRYLFAVRNTAGNSDIYWVDVQAVGHRRPNLPDIRR